jgi:gag-polyprotein putative aspartyl protease
MFDAIWDTGATISVISQAVIDSCGLVATGMAQVHGVHGAKPTETYLVNIELPDKVVFTALRVTKGEIRDADILIGMDIINQGDFSVTNCQGHSQFSYRTPSMEHIDYVALTKALRQAQAHPQTRAERRRAKMGRP